MVRMYADRIFSKACVPSRRAQAHLRAALRLPKRVRGGQPGNQNRLRHGLYTKTFVASRQKTHQLLRRSRELAALVSRSIRTGRENSVRERRVTKYFHKTQSMPQPIVPPDTVRGMW